MLRINQPVPLSRPSLFGFRSSALFSVLIRLLVASPLALPFSLRRLPFPLPAVVSPRIARTRAPPVRSHAPNIALIFRAIACATEVGRSHTCQSSLPAGHATSVFAALSSPSAIFTCALARSGARTLRRLPHCWPLHPSPGRSSRLARVAALFACRQSTSSPHRGHSTVRAPAACHACG